MKTKSFYLFIFCSFFFIKEASSQIDPFIGQIAIVGFNFAPRGWASCDGQLLSIAENTALFALLGTTYGGNGQTTFALPDLRGRVPIHRGEGPGLSNYSLGEIGGSQTITLTTAQLPAHSHSVNALTTDGNTSIPTGALPAGTKTLDPEYSNLTSNTAMSASMIGSTGGGQPVSIIQPYLTVHYIIALQGVFPPRN